MTQEEINAGNRLIADSPFSHEGLRKTIKKDKQHLSDEFAYSNLRFHSSWDWLMPVVEKIESMGYDFQIDGRNNAEWKKIRENSTNKKMSVVQIAQQLPEPKVFKCAYYDKPAEKINAVFQVVCEFINWYNQKQTCEAGTNPYLLTGAELERTEQARKTK